MSALYSFLRVADDLADGPGGGARSAARWPTGAARLDEALEGDYSHPLHPAFHHAVRRFGVPPEYLHAVLDGVEHGPGRRPL